MLTLKLLGAASVEGSDGPVTGRATHGRRLALLALLAVGRGRPMTRDKLITLLWPEIAPDRARPQLSDTLYILRSAVREDVFLSAGEGLVLNPDAITSDVAAFERLLDEGRLEDATDLFRGPLLDGFHISDAVEFEHWLDTERARLSRRYSTALESLAETNEAEDRFAAAAAWWRRLASHDPFSGRVASRLMRALEESGDRAGALQHARAHAALLRDEFDAEPDAHVIALTERLRLESTPRPDPQTPSARSAASTRETDVVLADSDTRRSAVTGPANDVMPVRPKRHVRAYAAAAGAVFVVISILVAYGIRGRTPAGPVVARSIGILPFVNAGPDPENAYVGDGLSEQIIASLGRIDELRVAARTSSFALRGSGLDIRAIGDTLGVEAVLEGSVRKDGRRLRVTAQLVDTGTGYEIWSSEYDRELSDIFDVQDEIASAIASALTLRLSGNPSTVRAGLSPSLEAYDLYLRGLYLRNSLSGDGLRQAADFFDRAIELEPDFALVHAAKASVVAPLIFFGHVPVESGVKELRTLVSRALELDPTLGEAYAALGILKLFFDWDWDGAKTALLHAIELNPSDPHAYHHLANYLHAMGRFEEAAATRERAVELDPLNARTRFTLASDYLQGGDPERAMAHFRRAFQLDPVNPLALGFGPVVPGGPAAVYSWQARYPEAVEEFIKIAALRGASAREVEAIRNSFASSGMSGFWQSWLDMDLRQSGANPNSVRIAKLLALIGDTTESFAWLDRAYDERNPGLIYLRFDSEFEGLHEHPRIARILRSMKFPS